jgi:hypothetical protein
LVDLTASSSNLGVAQSSSAGTIVVDQVFPLITSSKPLFDEATTVRRSDRRRDWRLR